RTTRYAMRISPPTISRTCALRVHVSRKAVPMLMVLLLVGCGASPAAAQHEEAAEQAARQWLALVDDGAYAQSWDEAAALFRAAMPRAGWESSLTNIFSQLGRPEARELIAAKYTTSLPNAQQGEYVVIQYSAMFNGAEMVETVTMMRDGDAWR